MLDIVLNPSGASGRSRALWKKLEPMFKDCEYALHCSSETVTVGDICAGLTDGSREVKLVIIGGDGTLNEALNAIRCFDKTLLGFIPSGTGNDMQRDMGLPKKRRELVALIKQGDYRRSADIGELSFYTDKGVIRRKFNISSDIGFGAATCAFAERSKLKPVLNRLGLGRLIYLIEAIKVCFLVRPTDIAVKGEGVCRRYKSCLSAIVMNHRHEGGGFEFCPQADFTDGQLDLIIGSHISKLAYLRVLVCAYKGRHLGLPGLYTHRSREFEMIASEPLWAHTDGEVLGKTKKVKMKLLDEKLRLMI